LFTQVLHLGPSMRHSFSPALRRARPMEHPGSRAVLRRIQKLHSCSRAPLRRTRTLRSCPPAGHSGPRTLHSCPQKHRWPRLFRSRPRVERGKRELHVFASPRTTPPFSPSPCSDRPPLYEGPSHPIRHNRQTFPNPPSAAPPSPPFFLRDLRARLRIFAVNAFCFHDSA
jgi:hypothetical protein